MIFLKVSEKKFLANLFKNGEFFRKKGIHSKAFAKAWKKIKKKMGKK